MGTYLNPGNSGFQRILKGEYIDKTGMLDLINKSIDTPNNLTCISRPRRFGKSYAAQMLCAYYDKTCDSSDLFAGKIISKHENYKEYMNKYDVIYVDMTNVIGDKGTTDVVSFLRKKITEELEVQYPQLIVDEAFSTTLINTVELTGNKFVMVIDEWDAPIREDPSVQREYLEFLRMLFKSSGTTARIFAAAYMTGILPIKKDGSQSAISDFREYTMIKPRIYGEYVGFTEEEVKYLCKEHDISFEKMRDWYDGYSFRNTGSVYNPNSVMQAIWNDDFDSYLPTHAGGSSSGGSSRRTETSAAESLMGFISRDYKGLAKTVAELIGGVDIAVNTLGFANDLETFRGRDDVLTLLIHLGYLAYNSEEETVRIPNEEIRREFAKSIREVDQGETICRVMESDQLFADTIHRNEEAVAAQIEKIHAEETVPLHYNREASLRSVIKLAYYTYKDNYLQWEELPAGDGYADVVYMPKRSSGYPALLIELKWNQSASGAIEQVRRKKYPEALKGYGGELLLVGVNYDKKTKIHTCKIEQAEL